MASNPLFIIPDFFCIFQKNLAMATLCLKEMVKFLWKPEVAIAKLVWKMQKKSGIMKSGLDAMPLFLLDDLLRICIQRAKKKTPLGSNCASYF